MACKQPSSLELLPEDNEGLIDHLRAIRGVVVAVFFEELPDGKVRVSMRSKDPAADVCAICQQFGGGGHTLAAGARVARARWPKWKSVCCRRRPILFRGTS